MARKAVGEKEECLSARDGRAPRTLLERGRTYEPVGQGAEPVVRGRPFPLEASLIVVELLPVRSDGSKGERGVEEPKSEAGQDSSSAPLTCLDFAKFLT